MGHSATARPARGGISSIRPNPAVAAPLTTPEATMVTDAELMLRVKRGDIRAFENLVGRHQRPLINYFFRAVWNRQTAEDMAQEVFLRIYTHAKDYEPQAKFTTYMYRVARNLWIDRMRHEAHAPKTVSLDAPVDAEGDTFHDVIGEDAPEPDARMEKEEKTAIVRKAIETLPEDQKAVLLLAEAKGMKYQEIAEALEIPLGTVKSRMHAAVMKLKDLLAGKTGELE